MNPFSDFPWFQVVGRAVLAALPGALILWLLVGVFARAPYFLGVEAMAPDPKGTVLLTDDDKPESLWPHRVAGWHYVELSRRLRHIPGVCWGDQAGSTFQREQCRRFWNRVIRGSALALAPVLGFLIFFWFFQSRARQVYQGFYNAVSGRHSLGLGSSMGRIREFPQPYEDFTAWLLGLPVIEVRLNSGQRLKAFLAPDMSAPDPSQKLAVFEVGNSGRKRRYVVIYYIPQMAIISGV